MIAPAAQLADSAPGAAVASGLVLCAAGIPLLSLATLLVRRICPGRLIFFARWGFSHVAVAVLLFVLGLLAWGVVVGDGGVLVSLAGMGAVEGAVVLFVFATAARLHPEGWRALGLSRGRTLRAIGAGLLAFAVTLPLLGGLQLVWRGVLEQLGQESTQALLRDVAELAGRERVIFCVLAVAVLPLLEELLFRGFLQPLFVQNLGDKGGVLATSLVFAALHGEAAFLPILGFSALLGALMLRTQRLACVWAVHAANNGLTLALLYAVPGGREVVAG